MKFAKIPAVATLLAVALVGAAVPGAPRQADTTPPDVAFVDAPPEFVNAPVVTFSWTPPTDDTAPTYLHLLLGTTQGSSDIGNFDVFEQTSLEYGTSTHDTIVYPTLVVRDAAENETIVAGGRVVFDFVAPVAANLRVGNGSPYVNANPRVRWSTVDQTSGIADARLIIASDLCPGDCGELDVTRLDETTYDFNDYLPSNLMHGSFVYHRLVVEDGAGNSATAHVQQSTQIDVEPPVLPTLSASVAGPYVTYSWGPVSDDVSGVGEVRLMAGEIPGSESYHFAPVDHPGSHLFFVGDKKPIHARLVARDEVGNLATGTDVAARGDTTPPAPQIEYLGDSPTIADTATFEVHFDEELSNPLDQEDVDNNGLRSSIGVFPLSNTSYVVQLTPDDPEANGVAWFSISPGSVVDDAGNAYGGGASPMVKFNHRAVLVGKAEGDCGALFDVPIETMNLEDILSFGFTVHFDAGCYSSAELVPSTEIAAGWNFDTMENAPGSITVFAQRAGDSDRIVSDIDIARLRLRRDPAATDCDEAIAIGDLAGEIEGYSAIDGDSRCDGTSAFAATTIAGPVGFSSDVLFDGISTLFDGTVRDGIVVIRPQTGNPALVDLSAVSIDRNQTVSGIALLVEGDDKGFTSELPVVGRASYKETLARIGDATTGKHSAKFSLSGQVRSSINLSLKGSARGIGEPDETAGPEFVGTASAYLGSSRKPSRTNFNVSPIVHGRFGYPLFGLVSTGTPATSWKGEAVLLHPELDPPVNGGRFAAKVKWAANPKPGTVTMKAAVPGVSGKVTGKTIYQSNTPSKPGFELRHLEFDPKIINFKAPGMSSKTTFEN